MEQDEKPPEPPKEPKHYTLIAEPGDLRAKPTED